MNLLPKIQKKRLRLEIIYKNIIYSGFILILLILILIFFSAGLLVFLNFKYQAIEKGIVLEQSRIIETETVKGTERKIVELNKQLKELIEFERKQSNLYNTLNIIVKDVLNDVEIYTLEIDKEINKVTVRGFASNRNTLTVIKEKLLSSAEYKGVDFPISNFTTPKDIDFSFNFIYEN